MSRTQPTTTKIKKNTYRNGRPIIIWDTETTGLSPTKNSLVEIGLMELPVIAATSSVYSFSSLIHPPNTTMPRAASRVHGITNPMMQDAPPFAEVWAGVMEYVAQVSSNRGRPIFVAHNLQFDLSFLREELRRQGLGMPDWDFACSLRDIAHVLWPGEKASLAALGQRFKIVNEEAHRALCDVEATSKILEHADRQLREAACKEGKALKPAGAYIREIIEAAARKKRIVMLGEAAVVAEEKQPKQLLQKRPQQLMLPMPQIYITPSGILWHSDRACERLDMAFSIQRVLRQPIGKVSCNKCVKVALKVEILDSEKKQVVNSPDIKDRIEKKSLPRRASMRVKQQKR